MDDAPERARGTAAPRAVRHAEPRARRRPSPFAPVAAALCLGGTLAAGVVALALKALLVDRLAWSTPRAAVAILAVGGGILLAAGFAAGVAGKKLCAAEVLVAALVAAALAHVPYLPVVLYHQPWALGVDPQTFETWAVVGTLACGLSLFLGSSFGFMLTGGGRFDLGVRYELFVALTFLRLRGKGSHQRRFSPAAVVTLIAILAVVIGVMALTIVLSVMSGFELDLKRKILGTNAHAVVLKYGSDFTDWPEVEKKALAVPGVLGATPFTMNEVMVSSETNLAGVVLKGIDPKTVGAVTDLANEVQEGRLDWLSDPAKIPTEDGDDALSGLSERLDRVLDEEDRLEGKTRTKDASARAPRKPPTAAPKPGGDAPKLRAEPPKRGERAGAAAAALPPLPGIVIGRELAHSLRVFVGDTVHVVSPLSNELGPTGPIPKSRPFRVAAIFYSGMYEYDSKFAYLALPEAQRFFAMDGSVTGLELKVDDLDATRRITRDLLFALDGYPFHTKDWGEMNRNLFAALAMEKLVMAIILGFASLPVGFLILSILMFLAFEKSKEIAVLKSMGARDQSVMKIFVFEGLIIGGAGAAVGLAAGLAVCLFIAHGGIKLDPSVYYIDSLPVRLEAWQFGLVGLAAVVVSYLATLYPALAASRLAPVEGLRDD